MPPVETAVDDAEVLELATRVRGDIIRPGDARYDAARRVYNALHDRHPALIIRATGVSDVIAGITFARDQHLELSVRGGAHSTAGFGTNDRGLVLDLSAMRGMRVDPERRTLRAEPRCTWADVNHATYAFGLAVTGGIVSSTGIAGLTLGGGIGFLARRCGLTCDNLLSADVVTAEGGFLTCSEDEHPDLFWAIRGGGGNFGVVTSFEYRLHPVRDIVGGPTFFPLEAEVLRGYPSFIARAPEELGALLVLTLAPPLPVIPEEWHGKPVVVVNACWTGAPEEADEILGEVAAPGPVLGKAAGPMPYPVINTLFDALLPPGLRHYWKGRFADDLTHDAVDVHLRYASEIPTPETATIVFPIDGACHRVAPEDTAFAHRDARFAVALGPSWRVPADDEPNMAWGRAYHEALGPHSLGGGYVNFMSHDDQGRVAENYAQNHDRLVDVKRRYDPTNLFHLNQNIDPGP